jgi:hypothetical protein
MNIPPPTKESPYIHRYPFDNKENEYNNSYQVMFHCHNCNYAEHIRVQYGIAKFGLVIKCDNCKCFQTL